MFLKLSTGVLFMSFYPMPLKDPIHLMFLLVLILGISPIIAQKTQIPALIILILFGMLLGDNFLGLITRDDRLMLLEKFGLLYIMLLAGLQINLSDVRKMGEKILIFGLLTFSIPLLMGISLGNLIHYNFATIILLGILYSPHTLISYPIILKLNIIQKKIVGVAVGGTIITSVLTLMSLSIFQSYLEKNIGFSLIFRLFILFPLLSLFYFWGIQKIGKIFFNKINISLEEKYIFVVICLFFSATIVSGLGIDPIVGAFISGLALNPIISSHKLLMKHIEFVGSSLFIPFFLVSVGVICKPQIFLAHPENLRLAFLIIISAAGAKFLAAWIAGIFFQFSFVEIMVMFGLSLSRAALVLVIALFGKNINILDEGIFNAIIGYIVVTCLIGPIITEYFGKKLGRC